MASKRSRRGRRILSAREAAQWDGERIRRFEEEQRRKREWISFVEIAEWYSDLRGPVSPKKAAALREQAHSMLKSDLLASLFEEGGRSRVLFRFPGANFTAGKMTRQRLQAAIDDDPDGEHVRLLLKHCWLPGTLFERWCEWHHLPKSPRFQPSQDSRARVSPDERSGLNTQPSRPPKPSNRGGRPPAVDWEALKDALREEIKIHGYPDPRNPPGWRGTKDAVEFAVRRLGKEFTGSHRTIEYNVRRILRELQATSAAKPVSR